MVLSEMLWMKANKWQYGSFCSLLNALKRWSALSPARFLRGSMLSMRGKRRKLAGDSEFHLLSPAFVILIAASFSPLVVLPATLNNEP